MSSHETESNIDNDGQHQEVEWNQPGIVDDNVASCRHASDATAIQAPVLDNPAVVASKLFPFHRHRGVRQGSLSGSRGDLEVGVSAGMIGFIVISEFAKLVEEPCPPAQAGTPTSCGPSSRYIHGFWPAEP
jgi:hypothetical protein